MRYYLVDRISEWEVNTRIRGVKNVAMTQLAGWLEAVSSEFTRWFLLKHVTSCKFYDLTGPGDQLEFVLDLVQPAEASRRRRVRRDCDSARRHRDAVEPAPALRGTDEYRHVLARPKPGSRGPMTE